MSADRSNQVFAVVFALGLLLKHSVMTLHILGILLPVTQILRGAAILVLVYALVVPSLHKRAVKATAFAVMVLTTTAFLANLWYNRYFGNYLSLSEIMAGEGYNPASVLLRHIVRLSDIVFILDVVILGFLLVRDRNTVTTRRSALLPGLQRRTRVILATGVVAALIGQGFLAHQQLGRMGPAELFVESTPAFAAVYGVVPLYAMESLVRRHSSANLDEGEIMNALHPSMEEEVHPPRASRTRLDGTRAVSDPGNVIVIQVESLDKKLIGHSHNGVEVLPFVNSLVNTSLYGRNFYAQHVNGSFDADFSLLTGLYPVNRHYSFRDNDMSRFPSLVKILADQGYQTLAFHGNDGDFFNRETAFKELGFDRFYSRRHFSREDRRYVLDDNHFGINDYDFLYQSLNYLEEAAEPFFAYIITVTSHTPFTFHPEEHQVGAFRDITSPLVRDFFDSIRFVDYALEMFFRELESRGLKDNTLVVVYSDHEAAIETPEYSSSINFEVNRNIKEPEHIPLIIRHPELEAGVIDKAGSITDLAPTILNILGFEQASAEFAGTSLLSNEEQPVLFIHELPQVLYRDQLFALELGELNRIGFIEGRAADISIPATIEELSVDLLRYSRMMMMDRRRIE